MNNNCVSVFCGSSVGKDPIYAEKMHELGCALAKNNMRIVYGGDDKGLMGALAKGAIEHDGKLTALVPEIYFDPNQKYHNNITVKKCSSASHRLELFLQSQFNIVALGGFGSMGEMGMAMTKTVDATYKPDAWVQPLIFFNVKGHWGPIKDMAQKVVDEKFGKEEALRLFLFLDDVPDILESIQKGPIQVSRLSHQ